MIEIQQRYMDATEQEPMKAYRNVFKDGKFMGAGNGAGYGTPNTPQPKKKQHKG